MSGKIEQLTTAQIARFPEYVERWTAIGLSTEFADRPRAETAVRLMYERAGIAPPKRIVWCGSPLSIALTRAIILKIPDLPEEVRASVGASVRDSVRDSVGASVRASVWASVWASVGASVRDSVGDSVRDSVGASVRASVWASVWASVGASVRDSVGDSVRDSVGDSVRDSVGDSVRDSVGDSVRDSVGDSVRDSVRDSVGASVRASVWASVGDSVRDSVWASIWASVWASVRASVGDSVWDSVRDSVWASVYGQHDASWLSFYRYIHDELGLVEQTQRLDGLWEFSQSAGWAIPCRDICFIAERHTTLRRDERGRLHCEDGPACAYPDGWAIYAIHGVRVPANIIESPGEITIKTIDAEKNTEVQRVMIERFGWDRYADECGAKIVNHDERWGTLYRKDTGDAAILFLRVTNRSAEPDGSFRKYILPVDARLRPLPDPRQERGELGEPQKLTALNAVASTFGMRGAEYAAALDAES